MAYDGDDPTLAALQEKADAVAERGFAAAELGEVVVEEVAAEDKPPAKSATRDEWDEYALSRGVDPDNYSTKEELIEALT